MYIIYVCVNAYIYVNLGTQICGLVVLLILFCEFEFEVLRGEKNVTLVTKLYSPLTCTCSPHSWY